MKITLLAIYCCLFLVGCASGSNVRNVSFNGENYFETSCNGTRNTYADCLEQASKMCSEYEKKAIPLNQDGTSSVASMNGQLIPLIKRAMLFKCE